MIFKISDIVIENKKYSDLREIFQHKYLCVFFIKNF